MRAHVYTRAATGGSLMHDNRIILYWRALKTLHHDSSFNVCLKKECKQPIWLYIKECAFTSNTWKMCPLQIDLKHLKCKFFEIGVNSFIWLILSVKDPLFL